MKQSTLQSLSRRVSNSLAMLQTSIQSSASQLQGDEEWDKPIYSDLSRMQRERVKMERLQRDLKAELRSDNKERRAVAVLARAGISDIQVQDLNNVERTITGF